MTLAMPGSNPGCRFAVTQTPESTVMRFTSSRYAEGDPQ